MDSRLAAGIVSVAMALLVWFSVLGYYAVPVGMWIDVVVLFGWLLMRKSFLGWHRGNLVIAVAKKSEPGLAHALTNYSQRISSIICPL